MNVDLEIFTFQNISFSHESLGMTTLPDSNGSERMSFSHIIHKVEDGFEVKIISTTFIPNPSPNEVFKDTFYEFLNSSVFYTSHNIVTDSMIAEFALAHISNCYVEIYKETTHKSNGETPYMIQIPSMSKLILMIES